MRMTVMHRKKKQMRKSGAVDRAPALKSASGGGYTFEDKVAALLFCEMLMGRSSLGAGFGPIDRLERQAADWEPFGDFLITVKNINGRTAKCGCSVKSNRPITVNGCSADMRQNMWNVIAKPVFALDADMLGL